MVTWQGSAPRSRSSASLAGDSSHETAGPGDEEHPRAGGEEALADPGDMVDTAETELAACTSGPAPESDDLEAQRAERRRADGLVVQAILAQGLHGPWHRALEDELIRYAVPVLHHLLLTGEIVSKASRLHAPPALTDCWTEFTPDDRDDFAHNMVASALPGFTRAVFEDRRWTPDRGASLKTYFVNACVLWFARLQAQWLRDRQAVRPTGLTFDPDSRSCAPDPANVVIDQDAVDRMLSQIPDGQLREVLVLRGAGWKAEEAARRAGLTPKAAEGRLSRFRKNIEERAGTEPKTGKRGTQGGR